jgi:hypothetical protein
MTVCVQISSSSFSLGGFRVVLILLVVVFDVCLTSKALIPFFLSFSAHVRTSFVVSLVVSLATPYAAPISCTVPLSRFSRKKTRL